MVLVYTDSIGLVGLVSEFDAVGARRVQFPADFVRSIDLRLGVRRLIVERV